ncbi:MAG: class I SAM-dependent methyltransferase, partial [Clostridia bacterium]|nr:class I SAM-dependent methyltransferase [Clostridia bacterium]
RLIFLNEVLLQLGLTAQTVHLRAEDGGKNAEHREKYDIACARAVARLNVLSEYCLPYVKKGGIFVAMKGPTANEEMVDAKKAIAILGGGQSEIICETLPENEQRSFIITKKISQTPPKYPRNSAKISKQPL